MVNSPNSWDYQRVVSICSFCLVFFEKYVTHDGSGSMYAIYNMVAQFYHQQNYPKLDIAAIYHAYGSVMGENGRWSWVAFDATISFRWLHQQRYPLVNVYISMENHHVQWVNMGKSTINHILFIAMLVYQRVSILHWPNVSKTHCFCLETHSDEDISSGGWDAEESKWGLSLMDPKMDGL